MFYRISPSSNKKVVGIDGVHSESAIYPINIWDPNYINQWHLKYIPEQIILPIPKIQSNAILTDLMSVYFVGSSFRLTISSKLKVILEKYQHGNIQFLPLSIYYKKEYIDNYWLTNIIQLDNDTINYEISKIYSTNYPGNDEVAILVSDFNDFNKIKNNLSFPYHLYIKNLVFKSPIGKNLLAIDSISGGIGYFVSEQLKLEINQANCTGVEFESIN